MNTQVRVTTGDERILGRETEAIAPVWHTVLTVLLVLTPLSSRGLSQIEANPHLRAERFRGGILFDRHGGALDLRCFRVVGTEA